MTAQPPSPSGEPFEYPDVLVLAGGGVLGEAWMSGVVGGIEDAGGGDLREAESIVGTSAGSIVGARLAAGRDVRRPPQHGGRGGRRSASRDNGDPADAYAAGAASPTAERPLAAAAARLGAAAASPLANPLLALGAPGGAIARAALLARVPAGKRNLDDVSRWLEHIGATFDGRLRVCCVDRGSGRRVIFGAPGAPPARVSAAVAASCAIPGVFEPVTIGGREYVDGGAWSQTNLDAASVGRATRVLCLNPVLGLPAPVASPWRVLHSVWRTRARVEALALRRRGAVVRIVGPTPQAAALMAVGLMDAGPRDAVLAAGYRQGMAIAGA